MNQRGGVVARKRPEEEKEARKLYAGGMKLKDIAKKIDKPEGTIRRWKCDYGWDEDQSERRWWKRSLKMAI